MLRGGASIDWTCLSSTSHRWLIGLSTQPSTWCKRKCDSSNQVTFFHCHVDQFWCSHAYCWRIQWWTGVSMGILIGLQLCSPIHHTVYSDTFYLLPLRTSINFFINLSNSSSPVGSDHTGQPSQPACINDPWPPMTLQQYTVPSLDHFW